MVTKIGSFILWTEHHCWTEVGKPARGPEQAGRAVGPSG